MSLLHDFKRQIVKSILESHYRMSSLHDFKRQIKSILESHWQDEFTLYLLGLIHTRVFLTVEIYSRYIKTEMI